MESTLSVKNFLTLSHPVGNTPSCPEDHPRISDVFRHHVTDPQHIAPYEVRGLPNYPGSSNLLYLPVDVYYSIKSLFHSLSHGDGEEIFDTSARLLGAPANLVSAGGFVAGYGVGFGFISISVLPFLPITYAVGAVLCVIEGVVDAISLKRQKDFEDTFDFEILSHLRDMVSDFDPLKSTEAIEKVTQLMNKDPESLIDLFGEDQFLQLKTLFNQIHQELLDDPYGADEILEKYHGPLEEIARVALLKNLNLLQQEFLQLNPDEVNKIYTKVLENNKEKSGEEIQKITFEKLRENLAIKKKKLARRIRPWMVGEASETISPLLRGLVSDDPEAIKEGLRLADDMHIQSKKKKIAHILGIIALVFAAASMITMMIACPVFLPFLLVGIATTFAIARAGVFSGSLDSRGWTFEPKKLPPEFIRNTIFKPEEPEELQQKFRHKIVNPLDYEYEIVEPDYTLRPEKMGPIPPSLFPSRVSEGSPELSRDARRVSQVRSSLQSSSPLERRSPYGGRSVHHLYIEAEPPPRRSF